MINNCTLITVMQRMIIEKIWIEITVQGTLSLTRTHLTTFQGVSNSLTNFLKSEVFMVFFIVGAKTPSRLCL